MVFWEGRRRQRHRLPGGFTDGEQGGNGMQEIMLGVVLAVASAVAGIGTWLIARHWRRASAGGDRSSSRLSSATARRNWPAWETSISNALMQHGWVEEYFLTAVPLSLRVPAMRRYVAEHPDDALIFYRDPPRIELANRQRMKAFLHRWKAAWELVDSEDNFHNVVRDIVTQFCDILGFVHLPDEERVYRSLHGFVVRAPALRLKIPPRFPIIFVRRHEGRPQDLTDLRNMMSILNMNSYFALIVDLNDFADRLDQRKNLKNLVRDTTHDFIVLDGQDLRQIIIARDPGKRLVEIILQQVDLTVVSPYVTSGPVPENMFFGRGHELKTITRKINETSFALIGGRKIGKTSTLAKVHRLLSESRPPNSVLYLDCQSVRDVETFFEAVNTIWESQPGVCSPEDLRHYLSLREQELPGLPTVILLDEVDALLKYDLEHGESLFRMFRALSQERRCRFVFCGERVLHGQLRAADSPLFNFCDVIHLGYLKESAARRIILEPMQTMGVSIQEQEEVVYGIIDLSTCHPNLVQYLCQQLILEANARQTRLITPADLEKVRHSSAFHEYFLEVTWGNTTPLERAITLLTADREPVSFGELQELLAQNGFAVPQEELERAIDGLRLYCILFKEGQRYRFASGAFAQVVRESQELDILLAGLRNRWREQLDG